MPREEQRGHPLDGWQKENLAAPKRNQQQVHEFPASVYEDERPRSVPEPEPRPRGSAPRSLPQPPAQIPRKHGEGGSGSGVRKGLTDEEKRRCPHGDTRWPPPHDSHATPLQLWYEEKGVPTKLYYHLIYQNDAPEANMWGGEIASMAKACYKERVPTDLPVMEEGKSREEVKRAKEDARAVTARSAFMAARMSKRSLRELSKGPRGTIWILDENSEQIWRCIEMAQKQSPHKAMSLGPGHQERFSIFEMGLKQNKWDMLLISEKVDVS